jgi:hypothetical protein
MFRTRETAANLFTQISRHLRPGGLFIATTIDSRVLVEKLRDRMFSDIQSLSPTDQLKSHCDQEITFRNEFNDVVLEIRFDSDSSWHTLLALPNTYSDHDRNELVDSSELIDRHTDDDTAFGLRYSFSLLDQPGGTAAVDAPEYVVPLGGPLHRLAEEHGLKLHRAENFQKYFYDCAVGPLR